MAMRPGDWIATLFGYKDVEDPCALVVATSRHKRKMTEDEIAAEIGDSHCLVRTVIWRSSTKRHRENDGCECEEGMFCEDGTGIGWVEAVICEPTGRID